MKTKRHKHVWVPTGWKNFSKMGGTRIEQCSRCQEVIEEYYVSWSKEWCEEDQKLVCNICKGRHNAINNELQVCVLALRVAFDEVKTELEALRDRLRSL